MAQKMAASNDNNSNDSFRKRFPKHLNQKVFILYYIY